MNQRFFLLAIALGATILPASAGFDSEALPYDWLRPTKGGQYVFVMLAPLKWRTGSAHWYWSHKYASDTNAGQNVQGDLAKKYSKSGLYSFDGSKAPLWTVDWYSFDAWPCSDGEHLVRWGPWARSGDKGQTLAVAFYRSGKEIKSHRVLDLPQDIEEYPRSISHYQWSKKKTFDDAGKRVKVVLYKGYDRETEGKTLMFSVPTGAMSSN